MRPRTLKTRSRMLPVAAMVLLFAAVGAVAGPGGGGGGHGGGGGGGGGGHGGGHGSGGEGHGGVAAHAYGGGAHAAHPGFGHNWGRHNGHPYFPGQGGWRGGWGFWGGIGLGWYVPFLPWGYETFWWEGVPYYYAGNTYYAWDSSVGEYQAVEPPTDDSDTSAAVTQSSADTTVASYELYAYPKAGQSEEQQARDRDECRQWASQQSGFDPSKPPADSAGSDASQRQSYLRAEAACLEARNYTVR